MRRCGRIGGVSSDGRRPGEGAPPEAAGPGDVRRLATGGAALLVARAVLIIALGLPANIVLARLLVPRDFGLVALGTVLITLGGYLAAGGLGAALIRRAEAPTRLELDAVNGLQVAITVMLALVVAGAAVPFGRDGGVVALMVASLPITVLRAPATIVLERRLSYSAIATVDVAEAMAFYVWAIVTVALGMGVWGMASAVVVRAVVGTAAMIRLGPFGLPRPRWSWHHVRPLIGFGLKLQTISAVAIVRDQGLNVAIAAIGGVASLGVWNLAFRVIQIPTMLFTTVGRISYAGMSRLRSGGSDPRRPIERGVGALTVITAVMLVALAGFAPALPAIVGHAWDKVPETLAFCALALLLNAPVYVMAVGYLYAVDEAGVVLRAMGAYAAGWLAVTLPLVSALGAPAVGLGWIAGAAISTAMLCRATARLSGASMWENYLPPAVAAIGAGAAGWGVAMVAHGTAIAGVLGAAAAELILVAGLSVARRRVLPDAYALVREAVSCARAPRTTPPVEPPAEVRA
jgi:O-antigen/teichoic acid export membrane protein